MRHLLLAVTITTIGLASAGAAASLGGAGGPLLAVGSAAVARCDDDGFGVSHATEGGRVATVTVTGIADPGCTGGQLSVTLTSGGAAVGGGGPIVVPADGNTAEDALAISVNPQPPAAQIDGFSVSVAGP